MVVSNLNIYLYIAVLVGSTDPNYGMKGIRQRWNFVAIELFRSSRLHGGRVLRLKPEAFSKTVPIDSYSMWSFYKLGHTNATLTKYFQWLIKAFQVFGFLSPILNVLPIRERDLLSFSCANWKRNCLRNLRCAFKMLDFRFQLLTGTAAIHSTLSFPRRWTVLYLLKANKTERKDRIDSHTYYSCRF